MTVPKKRKLCECCGVNVAVFQPPGTVLYQPKARCRECRGCVQLKGCGLKKKAAKLPENRGGGPWGLPKKKARQ